MDPDGPQQTPPQDRPPELRFLKALVTALAGVMIVGMISIVGLMALRLRPVPPPQLSALPAQIDLPEGAVPQAVTLGPGWIGVLTDDGAFLLFDADSGALRDSVQLAQPPQQPGSDGTP